MEGEDTKIEKEVIRAARETKYCSNCGAEIDKKAEICPKCGVRVMNPINSNLPTEPKNAGLAAVLSFLIPGLGQIYNGQVGKGVVLLIGGVISAMFIFLIVGIIPFLIIWIYSMVNAYSTAKEINVQLDY